jgi:hypothetical protein
VAIVHPGVNVQVTVTLTLSKGVRSKGFATFASQVVTRHLQCFPF